MSTCARVAGSSEAKKATFSLRMSGGLVCWEGFGGLLLFSAFCWAM